MAKFLVCADVHLNLNMWNTQKAIKFDSLFSFYSMLAIADRANLPIIFAGDIFDEKKITSELFLYVKAIRKAFKSVKIYYINGNHDCSDPSWLEHLDATHLNSQGTDIDGVTVCGIDYSLSDEFKDKLDLVYPYADVLITHQTYDCFFNSPSAVDHKLLRGRHLVLSGDYHQHMQYMMFDGGGELIEDDSTHSVYDSSDPVCENMDLIVSIGSATKCSIVEDDPHLLYVSVHRDGTSTRILKWDIPHRLIFNIKDLSEYTDVELIRGLPASPRIQDSGLRYKGVSYDEFMTIITNSARSMNTPRPIYPGSLGVVFVARTKEELDRANGLVDALKYGYVLYAPLMRKPEVVEEDGLTPSNKDTFKSYLAKVAGEYPCDAEVKRALIEYITHDSVDFLEREARKFGYDP